MSGGGYKLRVSEAAFLLKGPTPGLEDLGCTGSGAVQAPSLNDLVYCTLSAHISSISVSNYALPSLPFPLRDPVQRTRILVGCP